MGSQTNDQNVRKLGGPEPTSGPSVGWTPLIYTNNTNNNTPGVETPSGYKSDFTRTAAIPGRSLFSRPLKPYTYRILYLRYVTLYRVSYKNIIIIMDVYNDARDDNNDRRLYRVIVSIVIQHVFPGRIHRGQCR